MDAAKKGVCICNQAYPNRTKEGKLSVSVRVCVYMKTKQPTKRSKVHH